MKFDGMKKKEIYVDRKKHAFYIKERKRNGWGRFNGAESTIYVDEEDNIINIFPGSFKHLDEYILTVYDAIDHMSYYDIRTGEAILTEYDTKGRCFGYFENGIALIYDDDISNYHIVSREGEIGNCCTLRRIGKKSLLVQNHRRDKTLSLYDYNMNIIKKMCLYIMIIYQLTMNVLYVMGKMKMGNIIAYVTILEILFLISMRR